MAPTTVFAALVAAVFFKHVGLVMYQLVGRLKSKRLSYAEDTRLLPGSKPGDTDSVKHCQHAIRNGLENEPLFLLIALAFMMSHPDGGEELGSNLAIYGGVFMGARVVHAITFLARSQPLRTLSYSVGLLAALGLTTQLVMDVL